LSHKISCYLILSVFLWIVEG
jgi:hypothetical protein